MDEAIKRLGHLTLVKAQQQDEANAMHQQQAAASQPHPSNNQHQQPPTSSEEARGSKEGPRHTPSTSPHVPRNPEEWVEGLVSEMAAATSMQDARWVIQLALKPKPKPKPQVSSSDP